MRAAAKVLVPMAMLSACGGGATEPTAENNVAAPADIETLPADESSETSSAELANGVNDPDVNDLGNQH